MQLDGLTLFGLLSLSAMLVFYALRASQSLVRACNGRGVHRRVNLWLPSGRLALWRSRIDLGCRRLQAMAVAAASAIAGLGWPRRPILSRQCLRFKPELRKQRELLEPERLVEAVHQVEVLERLAGRPLHQIVDGRDHDGAAVPGGRRTRRYGSSSSRAHAAWQGSRPPPPHARRGSPHTPWQAPASDRRRSPCRQARHSRCKARPGSSARDAA